MDRPRFLEQLDVIKFVCKDFWGLLFNKQVDKLQTNYKVTLSDAASRRSARCSKLTPRGPSQGIYVLHDSNFAPLSRMSTATEPSKDDILPYTALVCGMLRGALSNLGARPAAHAHIAHTCSLDNRAVRRHRGNGQVRLGQDPCM